MKSAHNRFIVIPSPKNWASTGFHSRARQERKRVHSGETVVDTQTRHEQRSGDGKSGPSFWLARSMESAR